MYPAAPLAIVTCSDWPAFTATAARSAFTRFMAKSGVVGIAVGSPVGVAPGAPDFKVPNGVLSNSFLSTYQYHLPSTTFQVLGVGTCIGLSVKPGIATNCSQITTAFALVKSSE